MAKKETTPKRAMKTKLELRHGGKFHRQHALHRILNGLIKHVLLDPPNDRIRDWYVPERSDANYFRVVIPLADKDLEKSVLHEDKFFKIYKRTSENNRPILIVGKIGSGKTTFIQNLIRHYLTEREKTKSLCFIPLDFGSYFYSSECRSELKERFDLLIKEHLDAYISNTEEVSKKSVIDFILDEWREYFDKIEKDYIKEEIHRKKLKWMFENTLDISKSNTAKLRYLSARTKIIIFIDNIHHMSDGGQLALIDIAQAKCDSIGNRQNVNLVVTTNSKIFEKNKRKVRFREEPWEILRLDSPNLKMVIKKRLEFIADYCAVDIAKEPIIFENNKIELNKEDIGNLFELISTTYNNVIVNDGIMRLSNYNLKQALYLIHQSFQSQNYPFQEFLVNLIEKKNTNNTMLSWENVISGIMTGSRTHFSEKESPIINLYNNDRGDTLLRSLILRIIQNCDSIRRDEILNSLECLGYLFEDTSDALNTLLDATLIKEVDNKISVADCGAYYQSILCNMLVYLKNVLLDTNLDEDLVDTLGESTYTSIYNDFQCAIILMKQVARDEKSRFKRLQRIISRQKLKEIMGREEHFGFANQIATVIKDNIDSSLFRGKLESSNPELARKIKALYSQIPEF